jgi:hypothetical protein
MSPFALYCALSVGCLFWFSLNIVSICFLLLEFPKLDHFQKAYWTISHVLGILSSILAFLRVLKRMIQRVSVSNEFTSPFLWVFVCLWIVFTLVGCGYPPTTTPILQVPYLTMLISVGLILLALILKVLQGLVIFLYRLIRKDFNPWVQESSEALSMNTK